jgi:hypothetical protein
MRLALLAMMIISSSVLAWAADPFVGSWKLDMEKSSTANGKATEQRSTVFVAIPNGYQTTNKIGSGPEGQSTILLDGKEHEAPQSMRIVKNTGATSQIAKRVSGNIFETAYRWDLKTLAISRTEVSVDSKVLTITTDGTGVDGSNIHNVWVYVRK